MAYTDSWWSRSAWWNPLAFLSNAGYNVGKAISTGDASFLSGTAGNSSAASVNPFEGFIDAFSGSAAGGTGAANSASGFNNLLTGNLDFQRQLELMQREQAYNSAEAEKAHARSVALQENSASLERQLRQSQYQDTVAGMRAAGLNPAMMYGGGSGALVTSGAPAGGVGSRASIGSRSAVHAGQSMAMIAGAMISAGALLANSALAGKYVTAALPRKIGF